MTRQVRIVALSSRPGLAPIASGQEGLGILLGMFFAAALNVAAIGRWIRLEAPPSGWADFADLAGEPELYHLVGAFLSSGPTPDRDRPALPRGTRNGSPGPGDPVRSNAPADLGMPRLPPVSRIEARRAEAPGDPAGPGQVRRRLNHGSRARRTAAARLLSRFPGHPGGRQCEDACGR
jgi:hypothetical protein